MTALSAVATAVSGIASLASFIPIPGLSQAMEIVSIAAGAVALAADSTNCIDDFATHKACDFSRLGADVVGLIPGFAAWKAEKVLEDTSILVARSTTFEKSVYGLAHDGNLYHLGDVALTRTSITPYDGERLATNFKHLEAVFSVADSEERTGETLSAAVNQTIANEHSSNACVVVGL